MKCRRHPVKISSPDFGNMSVMPAKVTCDGENINPALELSAVPARAVSLALIMDDPDAVSGNFVHWVVFNIPPQTVFIKQNSMPGSAGRNSYRKKTYDGPCPPSGTHRYFFKLYALDSELKLEHAPDKAALEKAMQGHIIDKAELVGLYERKK